ncbi:hypothetical protein Q9L58_004140 [Maublancomyces gigas]|uniref:Uncharacterized protein n=1 Tax=Discina gigas TaxID=1032678 RepID=A0ABR3GM10_9PEZI
MSLTSPNRDQILANCTFLFASKVELITYHRTVPDPLLPRVPQRQYHVLVLHPATDCDLADRVFLRTSKYALTSDAALSTLADEIEGLIGVQVGNRDAYWPTCEHPDSGIPAKPQPEYSNNSDSDCDSDYSDSPDIQLALEIESVLALEAAAAQAHFNAELLADLECAKADAEVNFPLEHILAREIQLALEAEEGFVLEAAAARACFDAEMLTGFESPSSAQTGLDASPKTVVASTQSDEETVAENRQERGRKRTRREASEAPGVSVFIHIRPGIKPPPGYVEFDLEHMYGVTKVWKKIR